MKNKGLIVILIVVVIILGVLIGAKFVGKGEKTNANPDEQQNAMPEEDTKNTGIKTWSGNSRSIAIMIDNVGEAKPQAGLNEAAIVYEITVEGGLTRLLAVYKDIKDKEETIGPVRSARQVFI